MDRPRLLPVLLVASLALVACGSDDSNTAGSNLTLPATFNPQGGDPLVVGTIRQGVTARQVRQWLNPLTLMQLTSLGMSTAVGPSNGQVQLLYPSTPSRERLQQARDLLMDSGLFSDVQVAVT